MLVSVALVLLMMTMFAQVFVMSTDSLSQQRGIAENDQRARLVTSTIRADLDERTFRDVLPFRANEDTRQLGRSLSRRSGYFEIDEGNPSDDTDDVLQFTASVKIQLQTRDGRPFSGRARPMSVATINTVNSNVITLNGLYANLIAVGSRIWVAADPDSSGVIHNVPYTVISAPTQTGGTTEVSVNSAVAQPGPVYLSQSEPEFDDGVFGNFRATSGLAEVCYFLRNGILYRRILLIRETPPGGNAQPTWSTGVPILWNGSNENYPPAGGTATFWHDFDYSAFYFPGKSTSTGLSAPGVRFHNSTESLSNSSQAPRVLLAESSTTPIQVTSFPLSLGIPNLRFGHSFINGLPQDASTTATLNGQPVSLGRFNMQECASTAFGYPGYIPIDPVDNTNGNVNPFDRLNIVVNPDTGLVNEYSSSPPYNRRGEDVLLSNVLSFDIKVWDAFNGQFVDVGDSTLSAGPFHASAGVIEEPPGSGVIIGGRLNSTYGKNGHFRFDTWHPNAAIVATASSPVTGTTFYNEPPYFNANPVPSPPYTYNEPPYVPVAPNPITGQLQAAPLTAIQITINYRDVSSSQIRQVSILQSLVDRAKQTSITNDAPEE